MMIRITDTEAHLEGDWTLNGVSCNLDSLALSLQQLDFKKGKKLRINCALMRDADRSGLELFYVWIQCARFRGVESTLVNIPERLRHVMQGLIGYCYIDTCKGSAI